MGLHLANPFINMKTIKKKIQLLRKKIMRDIDDKTISGINFTGLNQIIVHSSTLKNCYILG